MRGGHAVAAIVLGSRMDKVVVHADGSGSMSYSNAGGSVSLRTQVGRSGRADGWS